MIHTSVTSFTIENIGSVDAEVHKQGGGVTPLPVGKKVEFSEAGNYTIKVDGAVAANVVYSDKVVNTSAGQSAVAGAKFSVAATVA